MSLNLSGVPRLYSQKFDFSYSTGDSGTPQCIRPPPIANLISPTSKRTFRQKWALKDGEKSKTLDLLPKDLQDHLGEISVELNLADDTYDPSPRTESPGPAVDDFNLENLPKAQPGTFLELRVDGISIRDPLAPPKSGGGGPGGPRPAAEFPVDEPLPEIRPLPDKEMALKGSKLIKIPISSGECAHWKTKVKLEQPTSTWLSITAKGIHLRDFIDFSVALEDSDFQLEPICNQKNVGSMWTMDHLSAFVNQKFLHLKPERGLKDALETLGENRENLDKLAVRIALAMKEAAESRGN